MRASTGIHRILCLTAALAVGSYGLSTPVLADIVPTSALLAEQRIESARDEISTLLQQERVAAMLTSMGVDVQSAQERVGALTESELNQLAEKIHELPAGEGALGTIALVLVILILLDVAGVTDIFPAI